MRLQGHPGRCRREQVLEVQGLARQKAKVGRRHEDQVGTKQRPSHNSKHGEGRPVDSELRSGNRRRLAPCSPTSRSPGLPTLPEYLHPRTFPLVPRFNVCPATPQPSPQDGFCTKCPALTPTQRPEPSVDALSTERRCCVLASKPCRSRVQRASTCQQRPLGTPYVSSAGGSRPL
uniref:Uncharacterized protein n=2 Tax=Ixodes scapularis TaxID=6945 RepID=A0A1S4M3M5_IXOSC